MIKREQVHASGYLSGRVTRWHTWPTLHRPNVAEHQCRVAQIYCELFSLPRAEVLYHCVNHDRGEQWAGDMPFGSKDRVEGLAEAQALAEADGLIKQNVTEQKLTKTEQVMFKICDMMEMYEFCVTEARMGNGYAGPPMLDLARKIRALAPTIGRTKEVENHFRRIEQ